MNGIKELIKDIVKQSLNECMRERPNKKCVNLLGEGVMDKFNYTHLAVNKFTRLIVDGWDYSDIEPSELKHFKKDYFFDDLLTNGFNPKVYNIITKKFADKNGITEWSNTGVFPLEDEQRMMKDGQNFWELARKEHPDWFSEE